MCSLQLIQLPDQKTMVYEICIKLPYMYPIMFTPLVHNNITVSSITLVTSEEVNKYRYIVLKITMLHVIL